MHLYISLGSNLGDRKANLDEAVKLLNELVGQLVACSRYYETSPVDMESSHAFLNAVAVYDTSLNPFEVLHITQRIEQQLGRTQKTIAGRHYDRPIDIDLLQMGNVVLQTEELTLPHPHMLQRAFVLEPLAEVAPDVLHALPPHRSFAQLWSLLNDYQVNEISVLTLDDWMAITSLLTQLTLQRPPTWEEMSMLIQSPDNYLAVLHHQDKIVGMATLCVTLSPTGRKAWIEDVVIDEKHRGRGLSHRLVSWAKTKAAELGVRKLQLTSHPSRLEANALYQSENFQLRTTNVYQYEL
ncbi:MAG: 2-amino-4-hydroxy-6-hydroxymethyldihydropteridine diphosphokinase [Bacteroidales bacterium]|nr:2-amino-4-hydroxy-6-hydroxymethyldihydropteridine diphosphokinase [Bacteroidales bacterium]